MSDLERGFEELPGGGGPPEGWQDKVLARIETPATHARWPLVLAGSTLVAAAAAFALFFALRPAEKAPVPRRPAAAERAEAMFERLEGAVHGLVETKERAYGQLLQAHTEAERALAEKALEDAKKQLEQVQGELMKLRVRVPRVDGKIAVKCDPNDPLCAIE